MNIPEVETIRKRIANTRDMETRMCFTAEYLCCARISEIIGRKCPSDITTHARGFTGKDVKLTTFRQGKEPVDAVVFTVRTAKRGGKERSIALPIDKQYEPLAEPLYNYIKQFGADTVFNFTRQKAFTQSKNIFEGLTYPIERYRPFKDGKALDFVEEHDKPFRTHALRHVRATELLDFYDFTAIELSLYGGWTLKSMVGVGSAMSRYTHLQWKKYFPKLLIER